MSRGKAKWWHSEKAVFCKPGRVLRNWICRHFDLVSSASRTVRNKLLFLTLPNLWLFCYGSHSRLRHPTTLTICDVLSISHFSGCAVVHQNFSDDQWCRPPFSYASKLFTYLLLWCIWSNLLSICILDFLFFL